MVDKKCMLYHLVPNYNNLLGYTCETHTHTHLYTHITCI